MPKRENITVEVSIDDDAMSDIEEDVDKAINVNAEGNVDSATNLHETVTTKGKGKKRKERSKVWTQFDKLPVGEDGEEKCVMSLSDSSFDLEKIKELVASAIAMHNLPFRYVEYEAVRACFQYLRFGVQCIFRNTANTDVLKLYELQKKKIKSMLAMTPGRISFTSDLWTTINSDGYLTMTVHFIDKDWILRKYILCLSYMPTPHTGVALADKIHNILVDWGIIEKLSSLTLDNASANDVCVAYLKAKLNSKKALMLNEKIRDSVKYVRGSQSRKEKFIECVKSLCLESKQRLRQDVPTRWNSTYLMLKGAIYYTTALEHLGMTDSNYQSYPSIFEWDRAKKLCKFLEPFYNLTVLFSRIKYPTLNLFFPKVFLIYMNLKEACQSDDDSMRIMSNRMKVKFEKYWISFNEALAIAVILDQHYKLQFVEFAYGKIYGNDGDTHFSRIRKRLFVLFNEYLHKSSCGSSSSASTSQQNINVE
ncbi:zinc finger BED domain-containing protein RICESLEEPER 2 [Canna indica]|uniref:Zinc finger BED domain-containing protein RICESLEEPER 2 n=1 Tax=Canna indica TaxID=4628 RepID=A0AAQ3KBA0_9LILI|nr:zinc finger BED domain-containing protein RICESLEEPER 2 [Canna indica]